MTAAPSYVYRKTQHNEIFDPCQGRTFSTQLYFYKHANPLGWGKHNNYWKPPNVLWK